MSEFVEEPSKEEIKRMFPICNNCKNHIGDLKCKAFNIIPNEILFGKNDHSKPLKGQENDIIFELYD